MTTMTLESQFNETVSENTILLRQTNHVEPFWKSKVSQGVFGGKDGVEISYAYVSNEHAIGSVVISSGRIESLVKYKELVYNLYHGGYSVFIHDHRGQGLSGRMTPNSHQGYVDDFDDYVADIKTFYDKVVMPKTSHKPVLLCHSMGSAIGALYCLKYPEDFSRVAFSAPMFGIRPAMPDWFACCLLKTFLAVNTLFSKRPWYFFGQKDYAEEPFQQNPLTHCSVRYNIFRQAYQTHASAQLGGVTGRWLMAAHNATRAIKNQAENFPIPALILQATNDTIVDNARQNLIAEKMPNCKLVEVINSKHELLVESDTYRDRAIREILSFFAN